MASDKGKDLPVQSSEGGENSQSQIINPEAGNSNNNEEKIQRPVDMPSALTEYFISFDSDSDMKLMSWLNYFETKCAELNLGNDWKLQNVNRFLKGKILISYINKCFEIQNWEQLKIALIEESINPEIFSFSDFISRKLKSNEKVVEYFHEKLELGRKLKLTDELILEGLTEGLNSNLRQLMAISPPTNPTAWIQLATKLIKISETKKQDEGTSQSNYPRNQNYVQKPDNFQNYYRKPDIKRWQNNTFRGQNRQQGPNRGGFWRSGPPERTNNTNQSIQFQNSLPPAPCRLCLMRGIENAYHWVQTCPFRNQVDLNIGQNVPIPEQDKPQDQPSAQ